MRIPTAGSTSRGGLFPLAVALLLVCAATAADAQGQRWLRHGPGAGLTPSDIELQRSTVQKTLESEPDGNTATWENSETGHSGSVTPLRSYDREGSRCRAFRLAFAGSESRHLDLRACRQADGRWMTY